MITWERFAEWLADHDLPTDTVQGIEIVHTGEGIYLRAEVLKLGAEGRPIVCHHDPGAPHLLTETLARQLVSFPDAAHAERETEAADKPTVHVEGAALTDQQLTAAVDRGLKSRRYRR